MSDSRKRPQRQVVCDHVGSFGCSVADCSHARPHAPEHCETPALCIELGLDVRCVEVDNSKQQVTQ